MNTPTLTPKQTEFARRLLKEHVGPGKRWPRQKDLAATLGIKPPTVSNFLNPNQRRKQPSSLGGKSFINLQTAEPGIAAQILASDPKALRHSTLPPSAEAMESATLPVMAKDEGNYPDRKTTFKSLTTGPERGPTVLSRQTEDEYYKGRLRQHLKQIQTAQRDAAQMLVEYDRLSKLAALELVTSLEPPVEINADSYYVAAIRVLKSRAKKR